MKNRMMWILLVIIVVSLSNISYAKCAIKKSNLYGPGPYAVAQRNDVRGYTIYFPYKMKKHSHPIVSWGNGAGVPGRLMESIYGTYFRNMASHGYVVIASHSALAGSGSQIRRGVNILLAKNKNPNDMFYKKLIPRAAVAGHSLGAMGASNAANHPQVYTVINHMGSSSNMHKPTLHLTGTNDFMQSRVAQSYQSRRGRAFYANLRGGRHTLNNLAHDHVYQRVIVGWLHCNVCAHHKSCKLFRRSNCSLCHEKIWQDTRSSF